MANRKAVVQDGQIGRESRERQKQQSNRQPEFFRIEHYVL